MNLEERAGQVVTRRAEYILRESMMSAAKDRLSDSRVRIEIVKPEQVT